MLKMCFVDHAIASILIKTTNVSHGVSTTKANLDRDIEMKSLLQDRLPVLTHMKVITLSRSMEESITV